MKTSRSERGMALIGVIIMMALMMSLAVTLAVNVNSDTQLRGAYGDTATGFYAAESGLNNGMATYRQIFLGYRVPSGSDFDAKEYDIGDREVHYQLHAASWMASGCPQPPCPRNVTIPSGQVFAGLNEQQYNYTVKSQAIDAGGNIEASVGAEFLVGYIPLFQFVAFYANDLEIAPGATMTLNGRVHTNANLYLGGANGPLNIADLPAVAPNPAVGIQVTAGGDIYRGRKRASECGSANSVRVDMFKDVKTPFGDLDPKDLPCPSGTRLVPPSELSQWLGTMLSRVESIAIPQPDIIARGSGIYWNAADLRIVLNITGVNPSIEVQDITGTINVGLTNQLDLFMRDAAFNGGFPLSGGPSSLVGAYPIFMTAVPTACASNTDPACYDPTFLTAARIYQSNMFADPPWARDFRRGGFYNHREQAWMQLLNINIRDLLVWNGTHGSPFFENNDSDEGGIVIFATVQGPNSAGQNNYGVRIFGSADLTSIPGGINATPDPTGITVVSDQALYVLGNYNITAPRQPASLIGDSVNILSKNYWLDDCANPCTRNDAQSVMGLGNAVRDATATTVNAAFLGGVDTTNPAGTPPGNYNGGLENYPRFHEDWSGVLFTYQGSFVSLGTPEHVDGLWCNTGGNCVGPACGTPTNCNIYNAPNRAWNFDPAYNNAANLPPLTPRFVYVQQVLFTEDFK